jgi:hypothetical protein
MKQKGNIFGAVLLSFIFVACQAVPAQTQVTPTQLAPTSTELFESITPLAPLSTDEPVVLSQPTATTVPPAAALSTTELVLPRLLSKYVSDAVSLPVESFDKNSGWSSKQAVIQNGELSLTGNGKDLYQAIKKVALANNQNIFGLFVNFKYTAGSEFYMTLFHGSTGTDNFQNFGFSKAPSFYPKSILVNGTRRIRARSLHGNLSLQPDIWLNLFMAVNAKGQPIIVIWDPNNPEYSISYIETMGDKWTGNDWSFALRVQSGTVSISKFSQVIFNTPR